MGSGVMMDAERVRLEVMRLMRDEFENNPLLVSRALGVKAERKVSPRTVQSWLVDPEKPSSRTCPAWALKALRDFLGEPSQRALLDIWKDINSDGAHTQAEFRRIYERDGVEKATAEIESDARALAEWENASMLTLARKLFKLERDTVGYIQFVHNQQMALLHGLEKATSYEELRTVVLESIRDRKSADAYVRQTRRAIEAGTDEFAHPEGLAG